jgi:hypothetical protein
MAAEHLMASLDDVSRKKFDHDKDSIFEQGAASVYLNYYPANTKVQLPVHADTAYYGAVVLMLEGSSTKNGLQFFLAGKFIDTSFLIPSGVGDFITILKGIRHQVSWWNESQPRYTLTFFF